MTDPDDWAKEDCACGHVRHAHGPHGCTRTVLRRSLEDLPEPVYADPSEPFGWPTNWPLLRELPIVDLPCPCDRWRQPEQAEPDWGAA